MPVLQSRQATPLSKVVTSAAVLVLTSVVCAGSAQQPSLTRAQAKKLIESDARFKTRVEGIGLADGAARGGVTEGLWTSGAFGALTLTAEGRKVFLSVSITMGQVSPITPITREVVAVTGITEESGLKIAAFNWRYRGITPIVARYAGLTDTQEGLGLAQFRLYDDGWRLENVRIDDPSRGPFVADPEALGKAADREAQLLDRLRASMHFSKVLGVYEGWPSYPQNKEAITTVTDVGYRVENPKGWGPPTSCMWYGQLGGTVYEGGSNRPWGLRRIDVGDGPRTTPHTEEERWLATLAAAIEAWRTAYPDVHRKMLTAEFVDFFPKVATQVGGKYDRAQYFPNCDQIAPSPSPAKGPDPSTQQDREPAVARASSGTNAQLRFVAAVLASDLRGGEPVDIRNEFPANVPTIFCYVKVANEREGQKLDFAWFGPDGQERIRSTSVLKAPQGDADQWAMSRLRPRRPLGRGMWQVHIYVDGVLAKQLPFEVR